MCVCGGSLNREREPEDAPLIHQLSYTASRAGNGGKRPQESLHGPSVSSVCTVINHHPQIIMKTYVSHKTFQLSYAWGS